MMSNNYQCVADANLAIEATANAASTKMRTFVVVLLMTFFITTLVAPATILNKISFAILFLLTMVKVYPRLLCWGVSTFSPLMIFLIFMYGFLLSIFGESDMKLSRQFMLSVFELFLIYLIDYYSIDLDNIVKRSGLVLAVFSAMLLLLVFFLKDIGDPDLLMELFREYSLGRQGQREFVDDGFKFLHFSTVPFLFLPFSLFLYSFFKRRSFGNLISTIFLFIIIAASASRGILAVCLGSLFFTALFHLKGIYRLTLLIILIPACLFLYGYIVQNTAILSTTEVSNEIKIGHMSSFYDNLNLQNLFLGDGLGSYYYSEGRNEYLPHTEITFMDTCRYFGFIFSVLLFGAFLIPSFSIRSYMGENVLYTAFFLLYLILALTNPVLINAAGFLVVLWYWSKILSRKRLLELEEKAAKI